MRDILFRRSMYHASADFAHRQMTHRSLGACAPKRYSAQVRRWVWFLGATGLPVGLHLGYFFWTSYALMTRSVMSIDLEVKSTLFWFFSKMSVYPSSAPNF